MSDMHVTHEDLIDYLHGELAPTQDAAIHSHLALCSACSETYESEASLTELLRRHARAEERELPSGVAAAIHGRLDRLDAPGGIHALRSLLRPFVLLPAAAALAAALYVGTISWHGAPTATSINAAYYVNHHAALTASAPFSEDAPIPTVLTSDYTAAQEQPVNETH